MDGAITAVALSGETILTAVTLFLAGAVGMIAWLLFNIGVQVAAPRRVAGRSLTAHQAAGSGGIAIGSWGWGYLADVTVVQTTHLTSAGLLIVTPVLGLWLPMPRISAHEQEAEILAHPEVRLKLSGRSGLLVVEIEYRVLRENARAFHNVMQDVQLFRQGTGAYAGSAPPTKAAQRLGTLYCRPLTSNSVN